MILESAAGIILGLFVIFSVVYLLSQHFKYLADRKTEEKLYGKNNKDKNEEIPKDIAEAVKYLSEKKNRYIHNYFLFLWANKGFGFISIALSILGLVSLSLPSSHTDKWPEYAICLSSVIFVICTLYITPITKVFQYLSAWRLCEKKMAEVRASSEYYASLNEAWNASLKAKAGIDPIQKEILAKRINAIATDISSVVAEAEIILTSEGE